MGFLGGEGEGDNETLDAQLVHSLSSARQNTNG